MFVITRAPVRNPYIRRVIDEELDLLFPELPAILLDGPKAVGKTETALQRCTTVRRLDVAAERVVIEADPRVVGADRKPVLIDEWQRVPDVFDAVRGLVDHDGTGGQYLLTGSAPVRGTHSGAGRITPLRMRPLCLFERGIETPTVSFAELLAGRRVAVGGRTSIGLESYVDEIIAGGFPGMRHLSQRALRTQLDGYVQRIVDHDLPEAGFAVRRPAAVLAWLKAYAAATSTSASWETIRRAATSGVDNKPARDTTIAYTELLKGLRILDPIDAWTTSLNTFKRLSLAPKHHLADPALAARLLDRTRQHLLTGDNGPVPVPNDGSLLGNLFESLAALSVRTYAQAAAASTYHLRTEQGRHEVDFVVEHDGKVLALEVKLSADVNNKTVEHLLWLADELGTNLLDAVVLTTGPEAYRRNDGVAVVPLALLGP